MELRTEEWMKVYHKLAEQLKMIYQDHLKAVILYGSAARGTATEDSDIDIMVLVDLSPDRLKDYEEKLCEVSTDFALEYFKVFRLLISAIRNMRNGSIFCRFIRMYPEKE